MTAAVSFQHSYEEGLFQPYVQERRMVASTPTWMFDLCQPAGDFPDPPLEEVVIIQDRSRARAVCDFGAGRFQFDPGSITVVPCMSATQITVDNPHNIRVLGFSPRTLNDWFEGSNETRELGRLHASTINTPFMHGLLERIWNFGSSDIGANSLYADAALLTLWAELRREAKISVKLLARGGLAPWQERRCTEYLNDHPSENVGLEHLAGLVGLSPFHFARAFKQSTGVPPHRFQLDLRITRQGVA